MKTSKMRKIIAAVLALTLVLALSACGGSGENSGSTAASESPDTAKTFKVGIVQYMDHASLNQITESVQQELDAKGQELGVTFDYKDYTENGQGSADTLAQIGAELVSDEVDIIVAIPTPTAQTMMSATEGKDIPIVFSAVTDPVGAKIVSDLTTPGGNVTGTSDALNTNAILDLMMAANPDTDTVGLLYSKSEDSSTQAIADAKAYLDQKGIRYVEKTGTNTDEISSAADALIAEGVDAVFTPTDNTVMSAELAIYEKFTEAKIPHYCGADSFALNGAFCGFGVDYANLGKETADMVVEILANGADPATLSVKTFDNGIATVNSDTCTALGYDIETIKSAFAPYCTEVKTTSTQQEFNS